MENCFNSWVIQHLDLETLDALLTTLRTQKELHITLVDGGTVPSLAELVLERVQRAYVVPDIVPREKEC